MISTHTGTNPELVKAVADGKIEMELLPQGTLVERIRAAGAGLGGILTPTGVGTSVEEGKTVMELDGNTYLLELPLRADIALLYAVSYTHLDVYKRQLLILCGIRQMYPFCGYDGD